MCIGAKKKSDLHPKGYWNGDDMHTKLNHVIAIFEITHPGKKGAFISDSSIVKFSLVCTSHKQRGTTRIDFGLWAISMLPAHKSRGVMLQYPHFVLFSLFLMAPSLSLVISLVICLSLDVERSQALQRGAMGYLKTPLLFDACALLGRSGLVARAFTVGGNQRKGGSLLHGRIAWSQAVGLIGSYSTGVCACRASKLPSGLLPSPKLPFFPRLKHSTPSNHPDRCSGSRWGASCPFIGT
jgi:hypothetical protein